MLSSSTTDNVSRFVLDNGLTVLIKENHAAPVAAVLAHVNIGYFHEPDRWNGIAHVIEHMFFKGTQQRPGKEQIAEEIRALGGSINAGTYYDETSYYTILPSAHVEKAIEIQADTFLGSLFDGEELAKELEVIIQESKQKRDNPGAMLLETMYARAFDHHRIRRWRIGPDDVLRALRHEDLATFVEQTYRPENIVVTIVGDVETKETLAAVERCWGSMPRGVLQKEASPSEPEHAEFRYDRMRGDIQQRLLEFGFRVPPLLHADAAPLMVLGSLLSDGRSARLFRALKEERRLVNSVWAGYEGFEDIGLFTMGAETVGDDPLETETALFEEINRLTETPPSIEELDRIKTRIESRRLYAQEEVLGMARNLASYEALGDYRLADEMLERLKAVTAQDIQRVARTYVTPDRATLLEYLPNAAETPERSRETIQAALEESYAPSVSSVPEKETPGGVASEKTVPSSPIVRTLEGGTTLLFKARRDLPIVALQVLFPGGKRGETLANAGITSLMLKSSLKGTPSFSAQEIANQVESLGSSIGLILAPDYFGYSMKLLADRVPEGLAVLREVIGTPLFSDAEVEKEKQSIYGEIRRQQDAMSSRAVDLFNAACYGEQAYGLPASGIAEAIADITPGKLHDWHQAWVTSEQAIISVVGSIEEDRLVEIATSLVPVRAGGRVDFTPIRPLVPGERTVQISKQQTASIMGFPGASVMEDDRHALSVLAEITSGLAGRFFQAVRGDNALAYAVSSFHRARRDAGNFVTYTATSPDREEMAREIILSECERLHRDPVGAKELADAKEAIRGEQVIGLQTFGAQAGEMAVACLYGMPLDATDRFVARVQALTAEELQDTARRYLTRDRLWLGVVRGTGQSGTQGGAVDGLYGATDCG